jgi:hypothetical protein
MVLKWEKKLASYRSTTLMGFPEVRLQFNAHIAINDKSTAAVMDPRLLQLSLQLHFVIIHKRIIIRKRVKHWVGLLGRINPENITNADVAMLKTSLDQVAIAYYLLSLQNKVGETNTHREQRARWQQIDLLDCGL